MADSPKDIVIVSGARTPMAEWIGGKRGDGAGVALLDGGKAARRGLARVVVRLHRRGHPLDDSAVCGVADMERRHQRHGEGADQAQGPINQRRTAVPHARLLRRSRPLRNHVAVDRSRMNLSSTESCRPFLMSGSAEYFFFGQR